MTGLRLRYSVKVYDKDGKLVREVEGESHSLLANFIHWLRAWARNRRGCGSDSMVSDEPLVEVGGSTVYVHNTISRYASEFTAFGSFDNCAESGIVVGSGTTPPTPSDYSLESQIPHGTGAGQLDYEQDEFGDVQISGNTISFEMRRMFINRTGNTITVAEIGIIMYTIDTSNTRRRVLIARDVLDTPVEVPGYGSICVTYTFYVTT